MKKILIVATIVLTSFTVHAQKSFNLSINGGVASPTGNFSKADYANKNSGYAKTGYNVNLSGVYRFNKSWGVGLLVGYSQFGFKNSINLAEGYKEDSGTDSTTLYGKGHNNNVSALVGPYYFIPVGKKVMVDIRALGGYVHTNLEGFKVYFEDYTDNVLTQKEAKNGAFGFQVGAGLKYNLIKKVSLHFNVDYFSSDPKLNIDYQNFVVNSGRRLSNYNESISGVNATVGVGFNLF